MKKIFTLLVFAGIISMTGYSQIGTADIAIENPRISGSTFFFDVYFKRTNNEAGWYDGGDSAALRDASWYFNFNITDLTNYQVVDVGTVVYPATGGYNHTIGTIGPWLRVDVVKTGGSADRHLVLDEWFKVYTLSADITGTATNFSNLTWFGATGMTMLNGVSVSLNPITSGCNIALNHKCWDGSSSGNWDVAANWSPSGVPLPTDDIIYPNDPTNEILGWVATTGRHATVANLRVNHLAEMPIVQNSGLTVTNNIELKGGSRNIILESGFNANMSSYAFIPEGAIDYNAYVVESGHIEVRRTLFFASTTSGYYMHQVAAPVRNVMLVDWDMQHDYSYAFEWRTATQEWFNIYATWRSTPPGYGFVLSLYDKPAGYEELVFMDNLVLNDTAVTFDAILQDSSALIGNPYTAPVDWDLMRAGQSNLKAQCRVWSPSLGNYVTYVGGTGGSSSARYIQPGQSFFIEASGGSVSSFNFDLADRVEDIEPYLKESDYPYLLHVYTEGGNETSCESYIRFKDDDGVTDSYDPEHDGKFKVGYYPNFTTELYTVGSDNIKLSVDARPMLVGDDVSVPLHFKPIQDDTYRIVADEESIGSFPPSISIMLEDTFEPQQDWIDLRMEGYYEFEAEKYDPRDRFIVHFYDLEFGIEDGGVEPIQIYSDRTDAFIINDSEQLIKEIQVYDVMGNLITRKATVNTSRTRLFISDEVGYYIVKVITDKAVYSEKVLITK